MAKNFSRKNLRGRSFKGQNLTGANFSHADIQGADFTQSILVGANFSHAQAGVEGIGASSAQDATLIAANFTQADIRGANFTKANLTNANFSSVQAGLSKNWVIFLIGLSLTLSVVSGILSGLFSFLVSTVVSPTIPYWIVFLTLGIFLYFLIKKGLWTTLVVEACTCFVALMISWAMQAALNSGASLGTVPAQVNTSIHKVLDIATAVIMAVSITGALSWALAIAIFSSAAIALAGTVAGVIAMIAFFLIAVIMGMSLGGIPAVILACTGALLGTYIAQRTMAGDATFAFIRAMVIVFLTLGGTSFSRANLTKANFTGATLKSTNLARATVTQICWYQAYGLDQARISCPILKNSKIRNLVVTKRGRMENFAGLILERVNLENADLQGADLSHTKLYQAILRGANLQRAKLYMSNLKEADLRGTKLGEADLTGAILDGTIYATETM
jgi:uncharacterized protein YjbI with pentapeptide repeats